VGREGCAAHDTKEEGVVPLPCREGEGLSASVIVRPLLVLDDTIRPRHLTGQEARESCCGLKGFTLRQVFARWL
jgi:hypothetical protein